MPTPDHVTTDKKVAVLIADGLEEVEALAVVDILFRAGVRADLIAVADRLEVTSSHRITLRCDALVTDVELSDYDLLFLPGGLPGTTNLQADPTVIAEVERRGAAGEPIAAICAAPSILAALGLLEGRAATANPHYMAAIAEAGADALENAVVVDGPIITSRGMGTAIELGLTLVGLLLDEAAVEAVKAGIVYLD